LKLSFVLYTECLKIIALKLNTSIVALCILKYCIVIRSSVTRYCDIMNCDTIMTPELLLPVF